MKHVDEVAGTIGTPLPDPGSGVLPPLPSEDQKFFDESFRAGIKGVGELVRKRKKPKP
ncbi:hypothetical protein [Longimicrobium sp.]|uniref:hypothetical protein n=1 Tax=Longimicrobium sp. TaxID=2029185 RepID=UPI002D06287E|nr:hypothetical protein [Longimicrobium sp.]HSU16924.1 hypothetical protein [Longimicrobium sp.]